MRERVVGSRRSTEERTGKAAYCSFKAHELIALLPSNKSAMNDAGKIMPTETEYDATSEYAVEPFRRFRHESGRNAADKSADHRDNEHGSSSCTAPLCLRRTRRRWPSAKAILYVFEHERIYARRAYAAPMADIAGVENDLAY